MTLVVALAGLLGLEYWRLSFQSSNASAGKLTTVSEKIGARAITALMSILTTIINYILSMATYILSDAERHKTRNDRLRHLIYKTIISLSINTVFLYAILNLVKPSNPLSSLGLVTKVMYLVILSPIINLIWYIILPMSLIYNIINRFKYRPDQKINLFQYQLDEQLQYPEFNFA